jgi:type IV pilus assembly protein PilB
MKQLGKLLIEEDMLTQEQLDEALKYQKDNGGKLGTNLVKLGYISEEALHYFVAVQLGVGFIELRDTDIDPEIIKIVSRPVASNYQVIPLHKENNVITFASADPTDPKLFRLREDLMLDSATEINYVVATESAVTEALQKYWGIKPGEASKESIAAATKRQNQNSGQDEIVPVDQKEDSLKDILEAQKTLDMGSLTDSEGEVVATGGASDDEFDENAADDAPVIRLVNAIISSAVAKGASDIHMNPFEGFLTIRYRIDGVLLEQPQPPPKYRRAMVARIKVMAKLDIMEKRKPQDGRIKIKVQGKVIDLRVSTLPTIYGENIVMRILDQESLQLDLNKLGFEKAELDKYHDALQQPFGMILHTGPTGSGKTTTLYSALSYLNDPALNIMTIEDPVEYQLPGIIQCPTNNAVGLDFANVLRANLRQDPNILMVGEIRDSETAEIAVKAALTGHLLFSTLHTNDAPSTIMRLVDMGIDPMYVGTAVLIVVAQRLVRRICVNCKAPYTPTVDELTRIMIKPEEIQGQNVCKGAGCEKCAGTGYKGRVALYEIMRITPTIAEKIFGGADLQELTAAAKAEGMNTLRELAIHKWKNGMTTVEEILRVTAD